MLNTKIWRDLLVFILNLCFDLEDENNVESIGLHLEFSDLNAGRKVTNALIMT